MDYDVEIFDEGGEVKYYRTSIDSYKTFLIKIDAILKGWMEKTGASFSYIQRISIIRK